MLTVSQETFPLPASGHPDPSGDPVGANQSPDPWTHGMGWVEIILSPDSARFAHRPAWTEEKFPCRTAVLSILLLRLGSLQSYPVTNLAVLLACAYVKVSQNAFRMGTVVWALWCTVWVLRYHTAILVFFDNFMKAPSQQGKNQNTMAENELVARHEISQEVKYLT